MLTLSVEHRRQLSAQGHSLNPVVFIGKAGLTDNVIDELNKGLLSHELIKIKVQLGDRDARKAMLEEICQQLNAAPVQHVGKILVIYRPKPEDTDQKKHTAKKSTPRRTKRSYQN